MRKTVALLVVIFAIAFFATAAVAKHAPLQGKDAKLHQIISSDPGAVQVVTPYRRAIKLKKLNANDTAYWHPDGGKYIMAGRHAYVWCKVYSTRSGKAHFHWVAVNTPALTKALNLSHRFASGVAFYKITSRGGQIIFEAFPYETLHAMSEGKRIVDIKE